MAEDTQDQGYSYPPVVGIPQRIFNSGNILIFIDPPKNENPYREEQ
jgi:hypothetical protein